MNLAQMLKTEPKQHTCKLPGYMSDDTVTLMIKYGKYSTMTINPLDYHGYSRSPNVIECVIKEIDFELSLRPKDADILLDHRLTLMAEMDKLHNFLNCK